MAGSSVERALGPWENADLRVTANADAGLGTDTNVTANVRFLSNVAKLVLRRWAMKDAKELRLPAVFLLRPMPPATAENYDPKRVPMLDNGTHGLNAKVWFVGAGPASGHYVPFEIEDDNRLFRFVTDRLSLADVPAIVYDPRVDGLHLRYYPCGLSDIDRVKHVDLPVSGAVVTFNKVSEVVERTYSEKMITPDAQPATAKLWKDAARWWPRRDAELRVQTYLEIALNTAFPTCVIRPEQPTPVGRLDLQIYEHEPIDRSKVTHHGVLELKVLRSFRETGAFVGESETRNWIKSGVKQAAAYRNSKESRWVALLCFDMRREDSGREDCFKNVKDLAKKLKVCLGRWFLYASSERLRSVLVGE